MQVFRSRTADEAWHFAMQSFLDQSLVQLQEGRGGATSELLHVVFQVTDPRQRWVVSRNPPMSVAFALVEVIGIINGRRDSRYLNYFNPALPNYAGSGSEYHGAYGHRLRSRFAVDQLERAFSALKANPESRQIVLQIWDPALDLPESNGTPAAPDIPCNVSSMLKIRNGQLHWTQVMRSNDIFRGLPYNFVQFTCLQEIMAGWLDCDIGPYIHLSDSLHLYEETLLKNHPVKKLELENNPDSIALSKKDADLCWSELNRRLDKLIQPAISEERLESMATMTGYPEAIKNILLIVSADSARRRQYVDLATALSKRCSNPLLRLLWERWSLRKSKKPESVAATIVT